ncbi:hypothetical protein [Yoonia sp. SS1-5]|uniref:Tat pathway signal sequence domain protein n=1 Tax=Yoonia rhodophyticola TaxID=3137370 RepID=A0AAN0MB46_9RHOB
MLFKNVISGFTAALFGGAMIAMPAMAQDTQTPRFSLELNNAADTEQGGCRLTYVAANQTGLAIEAISYQVAVFDADGGVTDLLVLEFGNLIAGKTKVVQFDLAGRGCADISRITVNEVAECALADGGVGDFCLTGLETASRGAIQFGI